MDSLRKPQNFPISMVNPAKSVDFDQISLDLVNEIYRYIGNNEFVSPQNLANAQLAIKHSMVQLVPKVTELTSSSPRCEATIGQDTLKSRRRRAEYRGLTLDARCHSVASHCLEGKNYCLRHTQQHLLQLILERQP